MGDKKESALKGQQANNNFSPYKNEERVEDMYLRISEKYQIYKDLSDRCLINTAHIGRH
jgi:hypothetical protein